MQQSRPEDQRKRALKQYWKGYDECTSEYKESQLRATDLAFVEKEIDEQLEDLLEEET